MVRVEDPLFILFTAIGASIFGGAVAGYILLIDQSPQTYLLLLISGAVIWTIGLISWYRWHKPKKKEKTKKEKTSRLKQIVDVITNVHSYVKFVFCIVTYLLGVGTGVFIIEEYNTGTVDAFTCTYNETQLIQFNNECEKLEIGQTKKITEDMLSCVCTGNICGEFYITKESNGKCPIMDING